MSATPEIELPVPDVQWAAETARASFSRWESQRGYYNNRLNSHFKGKLGELAVERFLLGQKLNLDSHFRFPDRENLADIVVKIRGYKKVLRIEVKTWSRDYWQELGRCISVDQFPDLKKKAEIVIWCVTYADAIADASTPVKVLLAGWSTMDEISKAPIQFTGLRPYAEDRKLSISRSRLARNKQLVGRYCVSGIDKRGKFAEHPFTYQITKDGKVFIRWQGKLVTTLRGKAAEKFLKSMAGIHTAQAQLLMARVTGHFKHGNEN